MSTSSHNHGNVNLHGKHAAALIKKYKHGAKVKMTIHGRIASMESRDDLGDILSSDSKRKSKGPSHHVGIDIEDLADESSPSDESE